MKAVLLKNFSTKETEAGVMKGEVKLVYKGDNVDEFFVRAIKLYKEATFNDKPSIWVIWEAIKSDQGMLQFLLLGKAVTF